MGHGGKDRRWEGEKVGRKKAWRIEHGARGGRCEDGKTKWEEGKRKAEIPGKGRNVWREALIKMIVIYY